MSGSQTPLYFFKSPVFSKLVSLNLGLDDYEDWTMQKRVLKCRELIFSFPNLIACPQYGHQPGIQAILQKTELNTPQYYEKLLRMNLKLYHQQAVTPEAFQNCVRYTIYAKLAPNWNQVGLYLVQGRNFLKNRMPMNAVGNLQLIVSNEETHLTFDALCIKLPQITEEHFIEQSGSLMPAGSSIFIRQEVLYYALPDLSECRVTSIYNKLPPDTPFQSMDAMKRHWKNMYGYRLPDSDCPYFVMASFLKHKSHCKTFIYPTECIRPCMPTVVPRVDPAPIVAAFLRDVRLKVGQLCGQEVRFLDNRSAFPVPYLIPAAHVQPGKISNISHYRIQQAIPHRIVQLVPTTSTNLKTTSLSAQPEEHFNSLKQNLLPQATQSHDKIYPVFGKFQNPPGVIDLSKRKNTKPKAQARIKRKQESTTSLPNKLARKFLLPSSSIKEHSKENEQSTSISSTIAVVDPPKHVSHFKKECIRDLVFVQQINSENIENVHRGTMCNPIQSCDVSISTPAEYASQASLAPVKPAEGAEPNSLIKKKKVQKVSPEEVANVVFLLKSNKIQAATVACLQTWLRERKIPFRVKDTKATLVAKVLENAEE